MGFRGEDGDFFRVGRVRDDFDGQRRGDRVEQGRVHEAILVAVAVPEQHAGFLLLRSADGFGLEVGARFAVELMSNGYGGGMIKSHQTGQLGKGAGDERVCRCGLFEG